MAEATSNFVVEKELRTPTRGEKIVNNAIWIGNNFILNYIMSISITDLFLGFKDSRKDKTDQVTGMVFPTSKKEGEPVSTIASKLEHTKYGEKVGKLADSAFTGYKKINGAFQTFPGGWFNNPDAKSKVAGTLTNIFTLSMGGHISAVIVKLMEDKKVDWARAIDNHLDKKEGRHLSEQERDARELHYAVTHEMQKKSWGKIVAARLAGVGSLMVVNTAANFADEKITLARTDDKEAARKELKETEHLGFRRGTLAVSNPIMKMLGVKDNSQGAAQSEGDKRVRFWSEMALFEAFCTMITTQVMERFAKHHSKKENPKVTELVAAYEQKWGDAAPRDARMVEVRKAPEPQVKYSDRHAGPQAKAPSALHQKQPSHAALVEAQAQAETQVSR